MSINRWMDKEAVVHIYNGILFSHKKEGIWVGLNEVDEPRGYYTEWNKSEREKKCILMHIYEIYKDGTDEPICRAAMETQTLRTYLWKWLRGREGGRYGKSNMETYITTCKIDSQWEFAVWLRELKPGLGSNLKGWNRKGDGMDVQVGGDMG